MVDSLHFNSLLMCLYPGLVSGGGEGEGPREGDMLEEDLMEGDVTLFGVLEMNKTIHSQTMTR